MRCASVRCASALLWISNTLSGLGGGAHDELTENETASRGANHRSEIGSYHLPIFISTTPVRFALSMCSSQGMQDDCGVPIFNNTSDTERFELLARLQTKCGCERSCRRSVGIAPIHLHQAMAAHARRRTGPAPMGCSFAARFPAFWLACGIGLRTVEAVRPSARREWLSRAARRELPAAKDVQACS